MTSDRRVAVVTGGASGIGEGCVRKMASEGYHVVVADRDIENARALVEELTTVGQWAPQWVEQLASHSGCCLVGLLAYQTADP